MIWAACTAVRSVYFVELRDFCVPAAVDVAAKLLALRDSAHRGDDLVSDHEGAHVAAFALLDELLQQDVHLGGSRQRLDHRLGDLGRISENDSDALGAFEQLDDHRRAAESLDPGHDLGGVSHEQGLRNADAVAAQHLQRAQLVARDTDRVRWVDTVDAHLLELPHDGGAEEGYRRADPRDHRIVVGQLLAFVIEAGVSLLHFDRKRERVQDLDVVAACGAGFFESPGAV